MEKLLNPNLIQKLETLKLRVKRAFATNFKGERRSPNRGGSVEFADYRSYQPGDDFRYVDWNIYARLDKLFLKMFLEEENVKVHILIDSSKSMDFGNPSKFQYAKKVAAAIAYISTLNLDSTSVGLIAEKFIKFSPTIRTKFEISKLISFLSELNIGAKIDLTEAFKLYLRISPTPKVMFLLTDLLFSSPKEYEVGLKQLLHMGFDLKIIHIFCDEELNPNLQGDLKLEDMETQATKEITINALKLNAYKNRFSDFLAEIERFCASHDISYARVSTAFPLEDLILREMRKKGMVN